MSHDNAGPRVKQASPPAPAVPDISRDLAELARAVREAVASWERTHATMLAAQGELRQAVAHLEERVGRLEGEIRDLRHVEDQRRALWGRSRRDLS
jgi:phage shock protein A